MNTSPINLTNQANHFCFLFCGLVTSLSKPALHLTGQSAHSLRYSIGSVDPSSAWCFYFLKTSKCIQTIIMTTYVPTNLSEMFEMKGFTFLLVVNSSIIILFMLSNSTLLLFITRNKTKKTHQSFFFFQHSTPVHYPH